MRLQKLAAALANSSHYMQVQLTVTGNVARSTVAQVVRRYPNILSRTEDFPGDLPYEIDTTFHWSTKNIVSS